MKQGDFQIGVEFWSGGKRWRCTDVGSRVIVAISLEPHEVVNYVLNPDGTALGKPKRHLSDVPSWLNGPPYAIVEHVFDENDQLACSLTREKPRGSDSIED